MKHNLTIWFIAIGVFFISCGVYRNAYDIVPIRIEKRNWSIEMEMVPLDYDKWYKSSGNDKKFYFTLFIYNIEDIDASTWNVITDSVSYRYPTDSPTTHLARRKIEYEELLHIKGIKMFYGPLDFSTSYPDSVEFRARLLVTDEDQANTMIDTTVIAQGVQTRAQIYDAWGP